MNRLHYLGIGLALLLISACTQQQTSPPESIEKVGPSFTLENTSGGQTSLAEFAGQPVLLYFHMAVG